MLCILIVSTRHLGDIGVFIWLMVRMAISWSVYISYLYLLEALYDDGGTFFGYDVFSVDCQPRLANIVYRYTWPPDSEGKWKRLVLAGMENRQGLVPLG